MARPRSSLVKDENGDLLADPRNILSRWKNYFSQVLNVHRVSDVRQKFLSGCATGGFSGRV
jgi:hypothetical protein